MYCPKTISSGPSEHLGKLCALYPTHSGPCRRLHPGERLHTPSEFDYVFLPPSQYRPEFHPHPTYHPIIEAEQAEIDRQLAYAKEARKPLEFHPESWSLENQTRVVRR